MCHSKSWYLSLTFLSSPTLFSASDRLAEFLKPLSKTVTDRLPRRCTSQLECTILKPGYMPGIYKTVYRFLTGIINAKNNIAHSTLCAPRRSQLNSNIKFYTGTWLTLFNGLTLINDIELHTPWQTCSNFKDINLANPQGHFHCCIFQSGFKMRAAGRHKHTGRPLAIVTKLEAPSWAIREAYVKLIALSFYKCAP